MRRLTGVGLGWRRQLAHYIDTHEGLGFVEVLAEHLDPGGPLPEPLVRLRERGVPVVLHAVSLGLGSAERPEPRRLAWLAELTEAQWLAGVHAELAQGEHAGRQVAPLHPPVHLGDHSHALGHVRLGQLGLEMPCSRLTCPARTAGRAT